MAQDFAPVGAFARLSEAARAALRAAATIQSINGGDYLVHEGEPADTCTADVRAMRDSTIFALTRSAYAQASAAYREIADGFLADVARRLARTTRALGESHQDMAVKPGRVVALLPFPAYLALRHIGRRVVVNAAAIAGHYGSVSVATFVTGDDILIGRGLAPASYMGAVVALMETLAIISAPLVASHGLQLIASPAARVGG